MHVVFNPHPAPTDFVDPGLDRHHSAGAQRRFDSFREARGFVHFQAQAVAEAVTKSVPVAALLDLATRQTICILPFHPGAN